MKTRVSRNLFTQFQFPWLKKFVSACEKIEKDPNYQPDICCPNNLLSLVKDENDNPKHFPIKKAMVIVPVPAQFAPLSLEGQSLGVLYQVLVTEGCLSNGWFSKQYDWRIDPSNIIFVKKNGEISIHLLENAINKDFCSPLTNTKISNFLNQECLHYDRPVLCRTHIKLEKPHEILMRL